MARGADSGGAVNVEAHIMITGEHGPAAMQSHAYAQVCAFRPGVRVDRPLGGQGSGQGVLRILECDRERVSLSIELMAATPRKSVTFSRGFDGVSVQISRVWGVTARSTAFKSRMSTNVDLSPQSWK